jgi:hypothetical protein
VSIKVQMPAQMTRALGLSRLLRDTDSIIVILCDI